MSPSPRRARFSLLSVGLIIAALVVEGGCLVGAESALTRVERHAYLMGTRARLATLAGDRATGLRDLERMLRVLEATEAELSTWRDDSVLGALNRHPVGKAWQAPASLCALLGELLTWHLKTGGAFDPAVGSLVAALGLRDRAERPTAAAFERARARVGFRHFTFGPGRCQVTRQRDVLLDAGAFGKGEALDRIARQERHGSAGRWMIDLGGQVAVAGARDEGWPVAIAHPAHRAEPALELRLTEGSLATSGGGERDRWVDGEPIGHILDPRDGRPVSRPSSATVWHRSALAADVLSTALYVMGVEEGLAWAEPRQIAACFIIPKASGADTEVRTTTAFRQMFLRGQREHRWSRPLTFEKASRSTNTKRSSISPRPCAACAPKPERSSRN